MAFTAQLAPLVLAAAEEGEETSNFLVPNGTFFIELAAFLLLFWLLTRYIIPFINGAMERRQEAIRAEFAELDEAKAEAKGAEEEYKAQLADARKEAARIREEAREQGSAIIAEAREQASVEANRVKEQAQARIAAGTYGTCIECGRPIGRKRLEAYPTAKRCIEDQQRREKLRGGPSHPRA